MNAHCCFFFFFKQKTAYEISRDWSSDVCSSDLEEPDERRRARRRRADLDQQPQRRLRERRLPPRLLCRGAGAGEELPRRLESRLGDEDVARDRKSVV